MLINCYCDYNDAGVNGKSNFSIGYSSILGTCTIGMGW